jgi:hypothetical protein
MDPLVLTGLIQFGLVAASAGITTGFAAKGWNQEEELEKKRSTAASYGTVNQMVWMGIVAPLVVAMVLFATFRPVGGFDGGLERLLLLFFVVGIVFFASCLGIFGVRSSLREATTFPATSMAVRVSLIMALGLAPLWVSVPIIIGIGR